MKVSSNVVKLLVAAGALAMAGSAAAQSKGQWAVSAGAAQITPHVTSGAITAPALPNSLGDVGKDTEPVIVVNYGITDNISGEFTFAKPRSVGSITRSSASSRKLTPGPARSAWTASSPDARAAVTAGARARP